MRISILRNRRCFVSFAAVMLGGGLLGISAVKAQSTLRKVGVILNFTPQSELASGAVTGPAARAIQEGIASAGWKPGGDIEILWRSAEGDAARFPRLIDELLARGVEVMVVGQNELAEDVRKKSRTLPIVISSGVNLNKSALVAELRRPGGNVTGLEMFPGPEYVLKMLEALRQVHPDLSEVALVSVRKRDREWGTTVTPPEARQHAALKGLAVLAFDIESLHELEPAIAHAKGLKVRVAILAGGLFYQRHAQLRAHAIMEKHGMAAMHQWTAAVENGGLMGYGIEPDLNFRKAGYYAGRILKGAKAGELPVERLNNYLLYINTTAAKSIGLKFPPGVLLRADKVIE